MCNFQISNTYSLKCSEENSGMQNSYQETQESRIPTRKLKKLGFLPGNSRVRDFWQEIQDFPGSQTLGRQEIHDLAKMLNFMMILAAC